MKKTSLPKSYRGFTLVELLVAMAVTIVLLAVLVYLTGVSMDTYRDSRNQVRASRQAKEAMETISKDLESMVSRRDGNAYEWLYAGSEDYTHMGPDRGAGVSVDIPNTSQLIFFSGATDRYNGDIGGVGDNGGDVSAVCYRLVYKDQISSDADSRKYATFSLYRHLVNPDEAFDFLAVADLKQAYTAEFDDADDLTAENFLVENIYEFTLTLLVEYIDTSGGSAVTRIDRVSLMQNTGGGGYQEFRLKGNAIEVTPAKAELANGRIVGAEVSITVLTDRGITLAKRTGLAPEEIIKKHSYHFTKSIITPRP